MDSHNRFFLVILEEMLKDDKISLPTKTVRKFGGKIPNRVVFKLPDSVEWEIEVIKSKEMFWFHRGWREFTEYYGLDHGSLLTLKFDGESAFKVCIFDKTANEIDYPCAQKTSKNTEFKEKDSIKLERDVLVEMRRKSSLPDPRPFKKVKPDDPRTGTAEFRDTHIVSDDREDGDEPSAEVIPITKWTKSISATKKIQALERTCSFKSANPFFRVVMHPSYISGSFNLYVPCKFARKYLQMKQGDCTFTVANGRTWHASYMLQDPHDRARFVLGWREFVLDNHLKVGDVCVFELIKTRQLSFKVSIFPADDCQDPSPSCQGLEKRSCRQPSRVADKNSFEPETEAHTREVAPREGNPDCHGSAQERAFEFTPRNPFFVTSVYLSHITGSCLFLPSSFRRTHLKGVHMEHLQDIVLQTSDGKKCPAKLHLNKKNQDFQVRINWYKFIHDNNLKKGDFCVFELILDFQIIFNVHIFRASESKMENSRHRRGSFSGGPKSWQIPRKHITQNPFFEIFISTSSILQASLHIPGKFANKYLASKGIEKVTLKVGDRRWVVRVKKYSIAIKLGGGWMAFARDNALWVGDVCIFELVGDTCEFQVSILRSS